MIELESSFFKRYFFANRHNKQKNSTGYSLLLDLVVFKFAVILLKLIK